jgi:2,3-bisphosphoglycerate-independent phosphoglycerate mutase
VSRSVIFIFLDGVGIGADEPDRNPFLSARMPVLTELLGGVLPTMARPGQTALLTGTNAARVFGRHFGPWTPTGLRPLLAAENVLVRARDRGRSVAFANAYPRGYMSTVPTRRQAAPPLAALAADCLTRHDEHLVRGDAVASGILNTGWRNHLGFREIPDISARTAGRHLAGISKGFDLTLFAHYDTDRAGHTGSARAAVRALERVDEFLDGVLQDLQRETLLVVASDHGNIEELDGRHTTNPVLGVAATGGAPLPSEVSKSILDIPGMILDWLE